MMQTEIKQINITEIMELIPHRYPLLLIDRVIEFEANKSIHAIKNVTCNEPQFTGHFPNKPIMPGVLIIEAMAQASAILVSKSMEGRENKDVYFMSIEKAKFRKIVEPGDSMHIYAEIKQNRGQVWRFSSTVEVDGVIVAESEFTAMVKNRE